MKSRKTVKSTYSEETIEIFNSLEYLTGKHFELYTRFDGRQDIMYNGQRMIGLNHYDLSELGNICLMSDLLLELIDRYG